jgi:hypothetical protein
MLKRATEVLKAVPVAVRAAMEQYAKSGKTPAAPKTKRAAKPKAARPARKRAKTPKPKP